MLYLIRIIKRTAAIALAFFVYVFIAFHAYDFFPQSPVFEYLMPVGIAASVIAELWVIAATTNEPEHY